MKLLKSITLIVGILGFPTHGLSYEEESFGGINPDETARPARRVQEERPKYREVYDQASRQGSSRDYGDDESIGVSVGVGFGFKAFSGSLGLTFPFNRFFAWGINGFYAAFENETQAQEKTGGGLDLIFRVPNPTPLTPFVSAGPGYESWERSADDGNGLLSFDADRSITANWGVGATVRLARYVSLIGALRSTTYTERPPLSFEGDHTTRDPRTNERFEFGFAFGI